MSATLIAILPELLIVAWVVTLFYRMNRRLERIERQIGLKKPT